MYCKRYIVSNKCCNTKRIQNSCSTPSLKTSHFQWVLTPVPILKCSFKNRCWIYGFMVHKNLRTYNYYGLLTKSIHLLYHFIILTGGGQLLYRVIISLTGDYNPDGRFHNSLSGISRHKNSNKKWNGSNRTHSIDHDFTSPS